MADVFVSYARKDREFVLWLIAALEEQGREVWVDVEGIPPSAEWMQEIHTAIEGAAAVVFVVSPDSVTSAVCRQELDHIAATSKRLIPIVAREPGPAEVPEEVAARNWIFARDESERGPALDALATALDTDLDWVHQHTRLLQLATAWEQGGRRASALLRGADLEEAERAVAANVQQEPRLAETQAELLLASRQAATRRQRGTVGVSVVVLAIVAALGVYALLQANEARHQRDVADERARVATASAIASRIPTIDAAPDVALLLAVEARGLNDSPDTRNALAAALRRRPALLGYLRPDEGSYATVVPLTGGGVVAAGDTGVDRWTPSPAERTEVMDTPTLDVAASGDGSVIAVITDDQEVQVVDGDGDLLAAIDPAAEPADVAVSSDGTLVAVGTRSGVATVHEATTGEPVGPPSENGFGDVEVAFDSVPGQVVTGGVTGTVLVVDIATGTPVRTSPITMFGAVTSIAVNGTHVAVGADSTSLLADLRTGAVLQSPIGTPSPPAGPIVDPGIIGPAILDDPVVLDDGSGSTDDTTEPSLIPPETATGGPGPVDDAPGAQVAFSTDGTKVVVGDALQVLVAEVAPVAGDPATSPLDTSVGAVRDLALTTDGTLVVAGTETLLWSLDERQSLVDRVLDPEVLGRDGAPVLGAQVTGQLSPNGRLLVLTRSLDTSRVVDAATGEPTGPAFAGYARFQDDEVLVAGTPSPYTMRRVEAIGARTIGATLELGDFATIAFASSRASDKLALGGINGEVRVGVAGSLDRVTLETLLPADPGQPINGLAFDVDGERVALARKTGLTLHDVATGEVVRTARLGGPVATSIAFSPDGDLLAVGTEDGPVLLLDAQSLRPSGLALEGHTGSVVEVAFRRDSGLLASLSTDGTVRLWDVAGRQRLGEPLPTIDKGSLSPVRGGTMSFSADGRLLLAPGDAGLTAWQTEPDDWEASACAIAGRNLTRAEWTAYLPGLDYHETCP